MSARVAAISLALCCVIAREKIHGVAFSKDGGLAGVDVFNAIARRMAKMIFTALTAAAYLSLIQPADAQNMYQGNGIPAESSYPDASLERLTPAVLEAYHVRLGEKIALTQKALGRVNAEWESARNDLEDYVKDSQEAQRRAIESVISLALGTLGGRQREVADRERLLEDASLDRFEAALGRAKQQLREGAGQGTVPTDAFKRVSVELENAHAYLRQAKTLKESAGRAAEVGHAVELTKLELEAITALHEPSVKLQLLAAGKIATEELAEILNGSGSISTAGLLWVRLASSGFEYSYSAARFWVAWTETDRLLEIIDGHPGEGDTSMDRVAALDRVLKAAMEERLAAERALPCAREREKAQTINDAVIAIQGKLKQVNTDLADHPQCDACSDAARSIFLTLKSAQDKLFFQNVVVSQTCHE